MNYTTKHIVIIGERMQFHLGGGGKAKSWNRQLPDFLTATRVFNRAALYYNLCLWTTELTAAFAQPQGCVLALVERGQNV